MLQKLRSRSKNVISSILLKRYSHTTSITGTRYRNRPQTVDVSLEKTELFKVFPEINEEILDEQLIYLDEYPDYRKRYTKLMYYNTHDINPRFLSRAIFTVHAYRLLEKPSLLTLDNIRKACILGWCHRMIDISIIIDDDIADDSKIRYNKPTWHQLDEVGINNAILDAAFIESAAHFLIINHFSNHSQYVNIQRELLSSYAHTNVAQLHEIKKRKIEDLEKCQNFAKFIIMTQPVVASALYLANIVDTDAHAASKQICLDIARFQKIDDDVKGIMTPFSERLKECTDISEGRTSWLAIEAYKRSNEAQRKILRDHYVLDIVIAHKQLTFHWKKRNYLRYFLK
ncbi:farnesyl pyrophosphate synthase-like [Diorhabda sublineata]|uniref:farnesyl pyrophosphate synthase-like n=1 Tax=Diorhabda sublineata TaxID=1163346 RepID=UPI0024E0BA4F|nr:farnesyl pyrophosphate synthase-like [Diorhabda sublineata]